jgi:hypothetical protein
VGHVFVGNLAQIGEIPTPRAEGHCPAFSYKSEILLIDISIFSPSRYQKGLKST